MHRGEEDNKHELRVVQNCCPLVPFAHHSQRNLDVPSKMLNQVVPLEHVIHMYPKKLNTFVQLSKPITYTTVLFFILFNIIPLSFPSHIPHMQPFPPSSAWRAAWRALAHPAPDRSQH